MVDLMSSSSTWEETSLVDMTNSFHDVIKYLIPICVKLYCEQEKLPSASAINKGKCEGFADIFIELVKASIGVTLDKVDSRSLLVESDIEDQDYIWDKDAMKKLGARTSDWRSANLIAPYTHVWVHYEGIHYDAECRNGTTNPLELPFFKHNLSLVEGYKKVKS